MSLLRPGTLRMCIAFPRTSVKCSSRHARRASNKRRSPPWQTQANALEGDDAAQRFQVTHPHHPLFQQTLEMAARGREWGEDRVYYRDQAGRVRFLPARWTSLATPDPFVLTAAGRAYFRLE